MNDINDELEKRIENRYKLMEEGLKDLISNMTEMLGIHINSFLIFFT